MNPQTAFSLYQKQRRIVTKHYKYNKFISDVSTAIYLKRPAKASLQPAKIQQWRVKHLNNFKIQVYVY